jgi:DNA-3-methyladenine glycosylase
VSVPSTSSGHAVDTGSRYTQFHVDPETLARRLLGQRLVRVVRDVRMAGLIVETEAYLGSPDRAAHTHGGRRTPRNESMYLEGGHAYVYFTYGMHHCVNVVCGRRDEGVAVLLRAIEPVEGLDAMRRNRPRANGEYDLCSGPARLCEALRIDRGLDGEDLRASRRIFIERVRRTVLPDSRMEVTARIGVAYAGVWARKPLRFLVRGSPYVSRP